MDRDRSMLRLLVVCFIVALTALRGEASSVDVDLRNCVEVPCVIDSSRLGNVGSQQASALVLTHASWQSPSSPAPKAIVSGVVLRSITVLPAAATGTVPSHSHHEVPTNLQFSMEDVIMQDAMQVHLPLHVAQWSMKNVSLTPSYDTCRAAEGVRLVRFHGGINGTSVSLTHGLIDAPLSPVACKVTQGLVSVGPQTAAANVNFSFTNVHFRHIGVLRGLIASPLLHSAVDLDNVSLTATDIRFEQGTVNLEALNIIFSYRVLRVSMTVQRLSIVAPDSRVSDIEPAMLSGQYKYSASLLSIFLVAGVCVQSLVNGTQPPEVIATLHALGTSFAIDGTCGSWVDTHRPFYRAAISPWPFGIDAPQRRPFEVVPAATADMTSFEVQRIQKRFDLLRVSLVLVSLSATDSNRAALVGHVVSVSDGNVLSATRVLGSLRCDLCNSVDLVDAVLTASMSTSRLLDVFNNSRQVDGYRGVQVRLRASIFWTTMSVHDVGLLNISQSIVPGDGAAPSLPHRILAPNPYANATIVVSKSYANSTVRVFSSHGVPNVSVVVSDNVRAPLVWLTRPETLPNMTVSILRNVEAYGIQIQLTTNWQRAASGIQVFVEHSVVGVPDPDGPRGDLSLDAVRQFSTIGSDPEGDITARNMTVVLRHLRVLRGLDVRALAVRSMLVDNVTVSGLNDDDSPRVLSLGTNSSAVSFTAVLDVTIARSWFETYSFFYAVNVSLVQCRGEYMQVRPLTRTVYSPRRTTIDYPVNVTVLQFVAERSMKSRRTATLYFLPIVNSSISVAGSTVGGVYVRQTINSDLVFRDNTYMMNYSGPFSAPPSVIGFGNNDLLRNSSLTVCGIHVIASEWVAAKMTAIVNLQSVQNTTVHVRRYSEDSSVCPPGSASDIHSGASLVVVRHGDGLARFAFDDIRTNCVRGLAMQIMRGNQKPATLDISLHNIVAHRTDYRFAPSDFVTVASVDRAVQRVHVAVTNMSWEVRAAAPVALHCVSLVALTTMPNDGELALDIDHTTLTALPLEGVNLSALTSRVYPNPPCSRTVSLVSFSPRGRFRRLDARVYHVVIHANPPTPDKPALTSLTHPFIPVLGISAGVLSMDPNATRIAIVDVVVNMSESVAAAYSAPVLAWHLYGFKARIPSSTTAQQLVTASIDRRSSGWFITSCIRHVNGTPARLFSTSFNASYDIPCGPVASPDFDRPARNGAVCSVATACRANTAAALSHQPGASVSATVHASGVCRCRCGTSSALPAATSTSVVSDACPPLVADPSPHACPTHEVREVESQTPTQSHHATASATASRSASASSTKKLMVGPWSRTASPWQDEGGAVPRDKLSRSVVRRNDVLTPRTATPSIDDGEGRPSQPHRMPRTVTSSVSLSQDAPRVGNGTDADHNETTTAASSPRRDAALSQSATTQVGASVTLAAFAGGAAGGAAADAQTMLLLGLSACGRDTTLGQAARDGIRTIYPLSMQSGGEPDAVRDGMTGSLAVVGAVLVLQLVAAGVMHRRQGQRAGSTDTASPLRALARVRCPAMAYRAMALLLPGLAFGAWQEVVGAPPLPSVGGRRGGGTGGSSQTSARDLAGTALGALALVVVASMLLLGVRVLLDVAHHCCKLAARRASDRNDKTDGNNTAVSDGAAAARWLSVPRRYGLAFAGWPTWAREWVLPSGFWHPTLTVKIWSPVFASTRPPPVAVNPARSDEPRDASKHGPATAYDQPVSLRRVTAVLLVPTFMNARSLFVGLLLAADGVGSCRVRTGLVAVLYAVGAAGVAAMRPFRFRLINVTAAASQASVAALTAIALPNASGESSDDSGGDGGPDASSVRRMVLLGLAATVLGSILAVAYVLLDRFKWRKLELAVLKEDDAAAQGTAAPLLQVPATGAAQEANAVGAAAEQVAHGRNRPTVAGPLNPLVAQPRDRRQHGREGQRAKRNAARGRPATPAASSGDL